MGPRAWQALWARGDRCRGDSRTSLRTLQSELKGEVSNPRRCFAKGERCTPARPHAWSLTWSSWKLLPRPFSTGLDAMRCWPGRVSEETHDARGKTPTPRLSFDPHDACARRSSAGWTLDDSNYQTSSSGFQPGDRDVITFRPRGRTHVVTSQIANQRFTDDDFRPSIDWQKSSILLRVLLDDTKVFVFSGLDEWSLVPSKAG